MGRVIFRVGAFTLGCCLFMAGEGHAEGPPPATAPAATWDAVRWTRALVQLGATSFSEREAASASLRELGPRDLGDLKRYAAAAHDAEVEARLRARVAELEGPQLTLQVKAPETIRFGDPCRITFVITNHYPDPAKWPAGKVAIVEEQWSTPAGGGGSAPDDPFAMVTEKDPDAEVVVPGGGSVTCVLAESGLNRIRLGDIVAPFRLESDDAALTKLWAGDAPKQTVTIKVQPSLVMEAVRTAATPEAREQARRGVFELLRKAEEATVYPPRAVLMGTIENTGPALAPYLSDAARDVDPTLRAAALRWFPTATMSINDDAAKRACNAAALAGLKDDAAAVRCLAIIALIQTGNRAALLEVSPLINDSSSEVRIELLKYLTKLAGQRDACALVLRALADADEGVRGAALSALEKSPAPPPADLVREALETAREEAAPRLLNLVLEQGADLPESVIARFAKRSEPERLLMISAYAGRTDKAALDLVGRALADPSPAVRRVALLRLVPFPREVARPLLDGTRATLAADLRPLADAVARELDRRALFPFLKDAAAARERLFPAKDGAMPRVSPDGKWVAYTETGRSMHGSGGVGRSNLLSATHVVRADGAGDQVVSKLFLVQWLADSNRVATTRDGAAAISDRRGNIVGEFGVPAKFDGDRPALDASWINNAPNTDSANMPWTKILDINRVNNYGENAAFSPDGQWFGPFTFGGPLEFLSTDGQTVAIGLDDGTRFSSRDDQAVWSPDGRYVARWWDTGMEVIDFQNRRSVANLPIEAKTSSDFDFRKARWDPWSKDGSRLVFVRGGQVWTCGPDGSAARQLTFDTTDKHSPAFSRDGKRIAYVTAREHKRAPTGGRWINADLWVLDVDSTLAVRATATAPGNICSLDWLPDDTVIFDRLTAAGWSDHGEIHSMSLGAEQNFGAK